MTMLSFRVDPDEAQEARRRAAELGMEYSEFLRRALHRYLVALASQEDPAIWKRMPLSADEASLASIADWGPAEDWSDWADAAR
jgi:antitoxin MazE2